jgi:hypothetical protein
LSPVLNDEVRLEVRQAAHPLLLAALGGRHVDVAQVQDRQRPVAGGRSGSSTVRQV